MAASDDFKRELREDNLSVDGIRHALQMALSEAIELQITTWVVPVDTSEGDAELAKPGNRMRTRINIVDGDINNEVGSQFLSNGPYTELRQFHIEQVQEGREIIQQNLVNLQHLFGVLVTTLKQLSAQPYAASVERSALPPQKPLINPSDPPSTPESFQP